MVAVIASGANIRGALSYNEMKVTEGKAVCLAAFNYPVDHDNLSFTQKLKRLVNQANLNERVKHKCLHISLNFEPTEVLTTDQLVSIADSYMNKLGFGDQPFLVYNHTDSAHPHMHIVTTTIRENGQRINIHDLANRMSEPARKQVEEEFHLVRAEGRNESRLGILGTKSDISNVVRMVYKNYKYTSFEEYKSVLAQFGIIADRGEAGTIMNLKKGLQYFKRTADGDTKPIKASAIYEKPVLKNIEGKFAGNMRGREKFKGRLTRIIDDSLLKRPTLHDFIQEMERYKINVLFQQNQEGFIYGVTYIDNVSRCIFNGSNLGKYYSAKYLFQQLNTATNENRMPSDRTIIKTSQAHIPQQFIPLNFLEAEGLDDCAKTMLDDLLDIKPMNDFISKELLREAKKKHKRRRR